MTLMFISVASHAATATPHLLGQSSRLLGLLEQTTINLCVGNRQPWDVAREAWKEVQEKAVLSCHCHRLGSGGDDNNDARG